MTTAEELARLRKQLALATRIIGEHQERHLRLAAEATDRLTAEAHKDRAFGFELSLDALAQTTHGEFGKYVVVEPSTAVAS